MLNQAALYLVSDLTQTRVEYFSDLFVFHSVLHRELGSQHTLMHPGAMTYN